METAIFGAGCFWGVEDAFSKVPGVVSAESGYSGGTVSNPGYEQVCSGTTGHAETVRVTFDPSAVSYGRLLDLFWKIHNPTTRNRQGPDIGSQYRSVIFYTTPEQGEEARASKEAVDRSGRFPSPVVTVIEPAREFWRAEEYHQQYHKKHGRCCGT